MGCIHCIRDRGRLKIKRIEVKPKAKLSLQMHHHRSEHWVVVLGTARVTNGDKVYNVHINESNISLLPQNTGWKIPALSHFI